MCGEITVVISNSGKRSLFAPSCPQHASRAGIALNVPIEPRPPAVKPILGRIVRCPRTVAFETEKDVPRGMHHDSHVPGPHDEIAWLGLVDTLKTFDSLVQIVRAHISVGKASALVDSMNQV